MLYVQNEKFMASKYFFHYLAKSCLSQCSNSVKKHHDHSYKRKHLIGGLLADPEG